MATKPKAEEFVPQIGHEEDPGLPGGGKGRVERTGMSSWTPPEGQFPPGEAYKESGMSGVMLPERFAEKTDQTAGRRAHIDIVPDNNHWVIVKGFRLLKEHETTGFSPSPGLPLWDGCWTGNRWAPTTDLARRFDNRREAESYLGERRNEIEAAQASAPQK